MSEQETEIKQIVSAIKEEVVSEMKGAIATGELPVARVTRKPSDTGIHVEWFNRYEHITQGRVPSEGRMLVHPRRYIQFVEAREENILSYETALNSVPILAAAVWLRADFITAYGYTFNFDADEELQELQKKQITFLKAWARFVELDNVLQQINAQMDVYGECFLEKVYDAKSYAQGGWGIKRLKVVHPYSVSVDRDIYGKVRNYVQEPYKIMTKTGVFGPITTPSTIKPARKGKDETLTKPRTVPAATVVHFKARDITNATYGSSMFRPLKDVVNIMLGMEDDIADIIRTTARPLTVWRMGDADNPLSVKRMREIAAQIMSGLARGSDIAIDGRVTVETVESGSAVNAVTPFQNYILKQIIAGLGVPDTLIGIEGSSNQAEAEIKQEMFRRKIMARQKYIGTKFVNEIFRDMFLFAPADFQNAKTMPKVDDINPTKYMSLPFMRWNEIESIADRRLRIEAEMMAGATDMVEVREDFGRSTAIHEDRLHPQLQQQLAGANLANAQADVQSDMIDIQKEQVQVQKEAAKNKPQPTAPTKSDKNRK